MRKLWAITRKAAHKLIEGLVLVGRTVGFL